MQRKLRGGATWQLPTILRSATRSRFGTSLSMILRTLMARIYQPQGTGPFPALLDVHGGAWNDQDPCARRRASGGQWHPGGAIDVRLAREAPYPSVTDTMLSAGSSPRLASGMATRRPSAAWGVRVVATCLNCVHCVRTTRAIAYIRSRRHPNTLAYVIARSPISDPVARYEQAQKLQLLH